MVFLRTIQEKVSNITCDSSFNLWVTTRDSIYFYNENEDNWKTIETNIENNNQVIRQFKNCLFAYDQNLWFISNYQIGQIRSNEVNYFPVNFQKDGETNLGVYQLCSTKNKIFLFSILNGHIYYFSGNQFENYPSSFLKKALSDKKKCLSAILKI